MDATITLAALSGTWRDSAGNSGAWVFHAGPRSGRFAAPAVSATRNYYLTVFGPTHTGELTFCGAEALVSMP